jgi:hypothetical protein
MSMMEMTHPPPPPPLRLHGFTRLSSHACCCRERRHQALATKALHVAPLICTLGPRRELPTLVELEALKRTQPVVVSAQASR